MTLLENWSRSEEPVRGAVQTLLKAGANVKITSNNERSLLYAATQNGYATTLPLIIDVGADVHATDNKLRTPLHYAVKDGYDVTRDPKVELLLRNGADIDAKDYDGNTPRFCLSHEIENSEAEESEDNDMNIDERETDDSGGDEGGSPLHLAAQTGNEELAS